MDAFGLGDWTASFEWFKDGKNRAEVTYNHTSRHAVFGLSRAVASSRSLRLSAFHEVLHLLFADLTGMAESVKNSEVVLTEEHRIIARMENFMAKRCGGKGKFVGWGS